MIAATSMRFYHVRCLISVDVAHIKLPLEPPPSPTKWLLFHSSHRRPLLITSTWTSHALTCTMMNDLNVLSALALLTVVTVAGAQDIPLPSIPAVAGTEGITPCILHCIGSTPGCAL